jgi:hypothetical protein
MADGFDKPPRLPSLVRRWTGFKPALVVAILVAVRFAWLLNHAEKWDTPGEIPLVFLCELPLLVALIVLRAGKDREHVLRSAGIAFGAALAFLVLIPLLFILEFFSIWEFANRYRGLVALEHFLPVCLLSSLWLLARAFSERKGDRRPFLNSSGIGVASVFVALALMAATAVHGSGEAKAKAAYQEIGFDSEEHIRAVAACLIRHQFLHPEEGFPSSLSAIGPDWNCDRQIADPWGLPGYWTLYSAVIDRSTGRAVDFRVQSIPLENGEWAGADKRGEVLVFTPVRENAVRRKPAHNSGRPYVMAVDRQNILSAVYEVRSKVRYYMSTHDLGHAPSSPVGVFEPLQPSPFCSEQDDPKLSFIKAEKGRVCYTTDYFPPTTEPPDSFAASVTCSSYGQECIRSYFMDSEGTVHATAEPRAATVQDPGLLPCEATQVCDDPVWTPSEQPSDWTLFKANLLYSIHSI